MSGAPVKNDAETDEIDFGDAGEGQEIDDEDEDLDEEEDDEDWEARLSDE